MKLLVIIHSLDLGGTQRFLSNLTHGLVQRGVEVDIVTLSRADEPDFFSFPDGVVRYRLRFDRPHAGSRWSRPNRVLRSIRQLRSIVRSAGPDVVLSLGASTNVISIISTRGLRVPVVVSERADPRDNPVAQRWRYGQRLFYPFADRLVTQTREVEDHMRRWVRRGRISTIPNPVRTELLQVEREPSSQPHAVAVCRLAQQKGVDALLRAWSIVATELPDAVLSLVGDGPSRAELERLADALGVAGSVRFHGMLDDPVAVTRTAWCGCLASRNEGFPNALLEMMAIGLPVVSTDCRSGPSELFGEQGGILVPVDDHEALAAEIVSLLADRPRSQELGRAARARAAEFEESHVIDAWFELFAGEVRAGSRRSRPDERRQPRGAEPN